MRYSVKSAELTMMSDRFSENGNGNGPGTGTSAKCEMSLNVPLDILSLL